jgi:Ca-activated chloride channel family protein
MRGQRLQAAVRGASAFARGLEELDEASLMLFSDRLLFRSDFTADRSDFGARLSELAAGGGTALNDHLFFAIKSLESRQGRRVVIVLSDGLDVDSVLSMEQVLWMIQRSRSVVYWIRIVQEAWDGRSVITPWRSAEEHHQEVSLLERAVADSGGRIVSIAGPEEAEVAFESILAELREQYVLGYYPDVEHDDGRWREVRVRVSRPFVRVRTRGGYLDY